MKKPRVHILVLITLVFAAFTLGLYLGRSSSAAPVTVSVPAAASTPAAFPVCSLPSTGGLLKMEEISAAAVTGPYCQQRNISSLWKRSAVT
jgi:hypothetical protein